MLEGLKIENYRALKCVKMGKLWNDQAAKPLTPLTAVIGQNGVGKSSLIDAIGFISDCLRCGIEEACDMNKRGGYQKIHSKGTDGPIRFEFYFREEPQSRPITYQLAIEIDSFGRPYVASEKLRQRRLGQKSGQPFLFLFLESGRGLAWKGSQNLSDASVKNEKMDDFMSILFGHENSVAKGESNEVELVELADARHLGIATLGALKQHPRISAFRKFIEGWYLSYFMPDSARSMPLSGPQKLLNLHGDNLGNVVQYMQRDCPDRFQHVLDEISRRIPGLRRIDTEPTQDDRILLRFFANGFDKPFYSQQMSDGTLKVFAYLLLLSTPEKIPLVCIEEPENGVYHKLLEVLAKQFREFATGRKESPQIFVTTHQPYFVNALSPEEVWILNKGEDGFSTVRRASDDKMVNSLVEQGLPLGNLWYSEYLDGNGQ